MAGLAGYYASGAPWMQFKMGQEIMSGPSQAYGEALSLRNAMMQQQISEMKIREHLNEIEVLRDTLKTGPQQVSELKASPLNDIATEDRDTPFDAIRMESRPETESEWYKRASLSMMSHPKIGPEGMKTALSLKSHGETLEKEAQARSLTIFNAISNASEKVGPGGLKQILPWLEDKFPEIKGLSPDAFIIDPFGKLQAVDMKDRGAPGLFAVFDGKNVHLMKPTPEQKKRWVEWGYGQKRLEDEQGNLGPIEKVPTAPKEPKEPPRFTMSEAKTYYDMKVKDIKARMMLEMTPEESINLDVQPSENVLALLLAGRIKSLSKPKKDAYGSELMKAAKEYKTMADRILEKKGVKVEDDRSETLPLASGHEKKIQSDGKGGYVYK